MSREIHVPRDLQNMFLLSGKTQEQVSCLMLNRFLFIYLVLLFLLIKINYLPLDYTRCLEVVV